MAQRETESVVTETTLKMSGTLSERQGTVLSDLSDWAPLVFMGILPL